MNDTMFWPELPYWPIALMAGIVCGVLVAAVIFWFGKDDTGPGQ